MNNCLAHLSDSHLVAIQEIYRLIQYQADQLFDESPIDLLEHVILFGPYARKTIGSVSDEDACFVLIILNKKYQESGLELSSAVEEKAVRYTRLPVSVIALSNDQVMEDAHLPKHWIKKVAQEGIFLLSNKKNFILPEIIDDHHDMNHYCDLYQVTSINEYFIDCDRSINRHDYKLASFYLHQAVEAIYKYLLKYISGCQVETKNILSLHRLALEFITDFPVLEKVFVPDSKIRKRCFERFSDASYKARYSDCYQMNQDEIVWLRDEAEVLKKHFFQAIE
ncbi:HEPN domain-containing protein [Teredinibacter sp. KSP-S5-2]|uniref:HEPN domain-containing protein n=1 Tax=Teredinibacter sp. KSP-S5-2 TaxID=3034506 RepID=UPI0029341760|nr:HEPN domain-containing protein [Teredinibacter sp. KSP-S5-2]WNO09415.1 HEPN domain-containing protein [Teredinibacter sp. KSP-S5-2]